MTGLSVVAVWLEGKDSSDHQQNSAILNCLDRPCSSALVQFCAHKNSLPWWVSQSCQSTVSAQHNNTHLYRLTTLFCELLFLQLFCINLYQQLQKNADVSAFILLTTCTPCNFYSINLQQKKCLCECIYFVTTLLIFAINNLDTGSSQYIARLYWYKAYYYLFLLLCFRTSQT